MAIPLFHLSISQAASGNCKTTRGVNEAVAHTKYEYCITNKMGRKDYGSLRLMGIMWPASQPHFYLSFIFIEMNFYLLSFLCDVCNEVHEHMQ